MVLWLLLKMLGKKVPLDSLLSSEKQPLRGCPCSSRWPYIHTHTDALCGLSG